MKLFLNKTSPYARMTRIVILEKGLADSVRLCWCDPWGDDERLLSENPVGRIPTLVSATGIAISESVLIANYLDARGQGRPLVPDNRKEEVLHLVGLGQGLMDASFTTVISRTYLNDEANNSLISQRRWRAIWRTLEHLEHNIGLCSSIDEISMGDIAVAVALDYLTFRLPDLETAKKYSRLEAWRRNIAQRTSFQTTVFQ